MNEGINASNILHAIHVPTLVIGRSGDLDFPIEDVRRTAERIPGAKFVELPGQDHFSSWATPSNCSSRSSTS
jgi:pimeloyl-ACP methyl ester carboxylesterase